MSLFSFTLNFYLNCCFVFIEVVVPDHVVLIHVQDLIPDQDHDLVKDLNHVQNLFQHCEVIKSHHHVLPVGRVAEVIVAVVIVVHGHEKIQDHVRDHVNDQNQDQGPHHVQRKLLCLILKN